MRTEFSKSFSKKSKPNLAVRLGVAMAIIGECKKRTSKIAVIAGLSHPTLYYGKQEGSKPTTHMQRKRGRPIPGYTNNRKYVGAFVGLTGRAADVESLKVYCEKTVQN